MNTTTTIPTRKSIREIVQEAKDRALIEIVSTGKPLIAAAFAALKAEADELKSFDDTYVPPWEMNIPPAVAARTLMADPGVTVLQNPNIRHAIINVIGEKESLTLDELTRRVQELPRSYGSSYIYTTVSNMVHHPDWFPGPTGWKLIRSGSRRHYRYSKIKG